MSLRVRRGSDANRRLSMIFMIAIAAVTAVLIAVAVFFQLSGNSQGGGDSSGGSGSVYDEDAERIGPDDGVEKSDVFAYSINVKPYFRNATAKGTLYIENPATNQNYMGVTIELADTGEVIYTSGMIQPNYKVETAALDVRLEEGVYPCIATFTAYDRNFEEVTHATQEITVYIKTRPE